MINEYEILIYKYKNKAPFIEWLESLNIDLQDRINNRIIRIISGNLGDHKYLNDGIFELRLHFGAGYRIYFGKYENKIILLLCGGDKSTQKKDIEKAKEYWNTFKQGVKK